MTNNNIKYKTIKTMDYTILSVAGKPGLYKLVSRAKMNLIVEALDETHRRVPVFASDRVTSLSDIAMYTNDEDVPLILFFVRRTARFVLSTIASVQRKSFMLISQRYCLIMIVTAFTTVISRSCSSGTISL